LLMLAAMLAFAAGALITALAFELFEDAHEQGGIWRLPARRRDDGLPACHQDG
jgi:hypothetical protein